MAHFRKNVENFKGSRCVHIRSAEQMENFTVYVITVSIGSYTWTVKHRYSEFYELHEKLTASYKLDKNLLPPKKIFGNQTETFIKKRQRELEIYLQTVIWYCAQHIPSCLAYFLDFDKYEIHGITQAMAEDLYARGDALLHTREKYEVSTLQLYSLTERLKLPEPTCESGDIKKDLGHILDYITRAKLLKVVCSKKPVGTSNIMMSQLPFDLTLFKSLQNLEICGCSIRSVNGLEVVKQTLLKFEVHDSESSMKEMFLQDASHWRAEDGSIIVGYWNLVTELDLSKNNLSDIHESIQLMPNVEKLNVSHNMIENIQNLQWLSQMTYLDLSHNRIRSVDSLHTKMGNVKCVRLAYNQLESLHGFAKLFSLQMLDISYNKIASIEELKHVSHLPCMEELTLEGNPVMTSLDYRTKTLEMFGERAREVILDRKPPNQKELDTVAVLLALKKAKDVKIVKKSLPKKNASAASLCDMHSQSLSGSLTELDDNNSRTTSPIHGILSRSVPSTEMSRRDSSSSCTQDPLLCSNILREDDDPHRTHDVYPNPVLCTSATSRLGETLVTSNNSTGITENTDNGADIGSSYLPEQVPEAHPFDLNIKGPTSFFPSPSVSSFSSHMNVNCLVKSQSPLDAVTDVISTAQRISPHASSPHTQDFIQDYNTISSDTSSLTQDGADSKLHFTGSSQTRKMQQKHSPADDPVTPAFLSSS